MSAPGPRGSGRPGGSPDGRSLAALCGWLALLSVAVATAFCWLESLHWSASLLGALRPYDHLPVLARVALGQDPVVED